MPDASTSYTDSRGLRSRAEHQLGGGGGTHPSKELSPAEATHELHVHQIELEIQNEDLRLAHAELEASRERYFDLFDLAPVGYFTLSEKGLILEANLTAAKLLGTPKADLFQQRLSHFIVPDDQDIYYKHRKQLFQTGQPQACELRFKAPGGASFWAAMDSTLQRFEGPPACRVVISDISGRKRVEEALQNALSSTEREVEARTAELQNALRSLRQVTANREQLQAELLKISEREKQLIAQELHDGLCQHFAGTALMASLLQRRLASRQDPDADQAQQICDLLNVGVDEVRNLSHGLHPVKPEGEGLLESLTMLAQTVSRLFPIRCSFRCHAAVRVPNQATATHLFRIAQEAINNAMKHGEASRVLITLTNGVKGLVLAIRDNGIGIPVDVPTTGMGMEIMRHRADAIGGTLSVSRGGRSGTVVCCTVSGACSA